MKINVSNLDFHPANYCNLGCEQCTHLSNYNLKDIFSIDIIKSWLEPWANRLNPNIVTISGGEPLANPDICDILTLTRRLFPHNGLRIITNGLLLRKFDNFFEILKQNDIYLVISNHSTTNSKHYDLKFNDMLDFIKQNLRKYNFRVGIDYGLYEIDYENVDSVLKEDQVIKRTNSSYSIPLSAWYRWYKNQGEDMLPYNSVDYIRSWNNCPVYQMCFQLYKGRIYKCAPLAYLPEIKNKFSLNDDWDPYLAYKPLTIDATDEEIISFFNKGAEQVCSMCPSSRQEFFPTSDPMRKMKFYKVEQNQ